MTEFEESVIFCRLKTCYLIHTDKKKLLPTKSPFISTKRTMIKHKKVIVSIIRFGSFDLKNVEYSIISVDPTANIDCQLLFDFNHSRKMYSLWHINRINCCLSILLLRFFVIDVVLYNKRFPWRWICTYLLVELLANMHFAIENMSIWNDNMSIENVKLFRSCNDSYWKSILNESKNGEWFEWVTKYFLKKLSICG